MEVGTHQEIQDDLEKVIEKDEAECDTKNDSVGVRQKTGLTIRARLDHIIHSQKFTIAVIVLVVLDCMMVIGELLFDLEIVELKEDHKYVPKIFHYLSLSILSLFLIEIGVRIYVLRCSFFKHKLEVLDMVVVVVSFILDIVFQDHRDASISLGLLVLLRLWRVARIVNGIILSVQKQAEKKIEKEKQALEACERELIKFCDYCNALEAESETLQALLRKHGIDFTVSSIQKPVCSVEISVEVEVNTHAEKQPQENTDTSNTVDQMSPEDESKITAR